MARLGDIDTHGEELSGIDDALDLISDVGFYVFGSQISAESAYNHFYYWIRGYWCTAEPYIRARQQKEPTQWRNVERLFYLMAAVEFTNSWKGVEEQWLVGPATRKFAQEEQHPIGSPRP